MCYVTTYPKTMPAPETIFFFSVFNLIADLTTKD